MKNDDIAIVSFAQLPSVRRDRERDEAELVQPVVSAALAAASLPWSDVGFVCSGSSDYLVGRPFSFVAAVDGLVAVPPIRESHVEMDGAWALYEAWMRLLHGDIDAALVFAFGKSSLGALPDVLNVRHDPYYVQPLGFDSISAAAIQAQAMLDEGKATEEDFARVAVRNRKLAMNNPNAQVKGHFDAAEILAEPYLSAPLRKSLCPPISDGAAAIVLARGDRARKLCANPAYIRGIDHRIEASSLGARPLTRSVSTEIAAKHAGVHAGAIDFAELHAPFAHQESILLEALGLRDDVFVNPSGGAMAANPLMCGGLIRIGEAAARIHRNEGRRGVAHATSGDCLQQNMVVVLEGGRHG